MPLADQLQADLKASMLAKDEKRTHGLRLIRAEVLKIEKEAVGTKLSDEQVQEILRSMVKQRRDSMSQYAAAGRADLVAKEQAELDVIEAYLPASLTDEELAAEVERAVAASGATSAKDMGKLMGGLMKALKATGKGFDGQKVNALVKARLGG